jgi:hypothetical protein
MQVVSDELRKESHDYALAEFTRPMEILEGLDEKLITHIRTLIYHVSCHSYIAGVQSRETQYITHS